ncbi:hypothetical protein [Pararhizobium haloflavum]|uniref:hypothetical protein n=1 Tax=Pararhizobium haloflavum TaxID=2037914 RepID=UPI000C1A2AAC|nr:hypothetical protein [Pararhizobium haloflavum]
MPIKRGSGPLFWWNCAAFLACFTPAWFFYHQYDQIAVGSGLLALAITQMALGVFDQSGPPFAIKWEIDYLNKHVAREGAQFNYQVVIPGILHRVVKHRDGSGRKEALEADEIEPVSGSV